MIGQEHDPLSQLVADIRSCRICEQHLPLGPRPILRVDPAASILLVGQAPGRRVHETGIPWNDPSGDRLRRWLGMDRDFFYNEKHVAIVPMGFCYPGSATRGDLPPRPECAATWHPRLFPMLNQVQLTLAIGQYAQAYFLPKSRSKSLTETVAAWRFHLESGVLPLPHPSPRNIKWFQDRPWFESEVMPAMRARVWEVFGAISEE